MIARYHIDITNEALGDSFNRVDLDAVIRANLSQDSLGNLFNPIVHFDNSRLAAGEAYVVRQRKLAVDAMSAGYRQEALSALGRLLHTRQDFYAHSNWVALWVERHGGLGSVDPAAIEICSDPTGDPDLITGRASTLLYLACRLPIVGRWVQANKVPADSHEAMNLDSPERGPLFPYAINAATRHSRQELGLLLADLGRRAGPQVVRQFLSVPGSY